MLNSMICESYVTSSEYIHTVKCYEDQKQIKYYLKNGDLFLGRFYFDEKDNMPTTYYEKGADTYKCTIYGPTCDSSDYVSEDVQLKNYNIGDHFTFENVGYSSLVFQGSAFNGFTD